MPPKRERRDLQEAQRRDSGSTPTRFHPNTFPSQDVQNVCPMLRTAPSQQFRSAVGETSVVQESRTWINEKLRSVRVSVRKCGGCGIKLLGLHRADSFAEPDGWCCGSASRSRRHVPWPSLPWEIDVHDFSKYARVLNSLLSVSVSREEKR